MLKKQKKPNTSAQFGLYLTKKLPPSLNMEPNPDS